MSFLFWYINLEIRVPLSFQNYGLSIRRNGLLLIYNLDSTFVPDPHHCNMPGTGLLLVFSEPGTEVSLSEFTDWYDNEHVPLRMNRFTSFLTGARYQTPSSHDKATRSAQNPGWAALYDLTSCEALFDPAYTVLRTTRSPRETDVIKRLAVLDRRSYDLVADSGETNESTGWGVPNPTVWLKMTGMEIKTGDSEHEWTRKLLDKVNGTDDWIRTRIYRFVEGGKSGVGITQSAEDQFVPKYMVIHETKTEESLAKLKLDDSALEVSEERVWELYRAWPNLALKA
jgi:hypothetical protein